jgi:predicted permease
MLEFLSVLLPVFGIFVLGFVGQKKFHFDTKGISTMALYLMSPFLVFRTFYTTAFTIEYLSFVVYTFGLCFCLILVGYLLSFIRNYSNTEKCGFILSSSFMNNGNYGTPVVLLIFGTAGLHYGIILMVVQQLVMCTIGVYFAAKGNSESNGMRSAINSVLRVPIVYAAIIGLICQVLNITLTKSVLTAIDLVANAAIPTIMIALGMQLATLSIKKLEIERMSLGLIVKLAISPIIAFGIAYFLPVDDMVKQIMVIMAAMPTAANTTMYALQFNTEPDFVSSVTFVSTLLSLATLPIVFFLIL